MRNLSCWAIFAASAISLQAQCVGLVLASESTVTIRNTRLDLKITAIAILQKSNDHGVSKSQLQTTDLLLGNGDTSQWPADAIHQFSTTSDTPPTCAVMYENGVTEGDETLSHSLALLRRSELKALPDLEHYLERLRLTSSSAADYREGLEQYANKHATVTIPQFNSTGATPFTTMRNDALESGASTNSVSMLARALVRQLNVWQLNDDQPSDIGAHLLETLHAWQLELQKAF